MKNIIKLVKKLFKKEETGTITRWAEREVEIACKQEHNGAPYGEWNYSVACYESALKALKCLIGDGHSGYSISITQNILNRLINGSPLTAIEDTDDIWNGLDTHRLMTSNKGYISYQCIRMSSLFKHVYKDGTVKYVDFNNNYSVNIDNLNSMYHGGLVQDIMDEMFPITMPYYPGKVTKFVCQDFLTDKKNEDFDTVGVFYCVKPDGKRVEINRYYKSIESGWEEITIKEYLERKKKEVIPKYLIPVTNKEGIV